MRLQGVTRTAEQCHQLIKRMEPLTEENEKLKEAMNLMEKTSRGPRVSETLLSLMCET